MEGDAVGIEPPVLGLAQQVLGHLRRAAELLAERPFGAAAIDQHAAEHARARRHAGELLQLGLAVEGEQAHALLVGPGDVLLLLDGVAEGDAVDGDAGRPGRARSRRGSRCRTSSRRSPGAPGSAPPGWPSRRRRCAPPAAARACAGSCSRRRRDRPPGTASRAAALGDNEKYARSSLGGSPSISQDGSVESVERDVRCQTGSVRQPILDGVGSPLKRKIERSGPVRTDQANDIIAGGTPRAVSKHIRSSFPDPARSRHCQKEHFPSLRNHYGPAARALGVLNSVNTTNRRSYKRILPRLGNFWGLVFKKTHKRVSARGSGRAAAAGSTRRAR